MGRAGGFIDLTFDIVAETTSLVERTHDSVVKRSVRRFAPIEPVTSVARVVTGVQLVISGAVFDSIRLINQTSRAAVTGAVGIAEATFEETAEDRLATPVSSAALGTGGWVLDYVQSAINGFWGDYLDRRQSDLDFGMTVRQDGRIVDLSPEGLIEAFPEATPRVCVFVHCLAATEWVWSLGAEQHYGSPKVTLGTRLRDDLGYTPVYVRYNTGRHVSHNGQELASLVTELIEHWPVQVEEVALVGHSMGGLVARSAAHYAREARAPWIGRLRHVACIGSPHLGAPLEKAVHVLSAVLRRVEAAGAQVPAALLDARSDGVKDLRYGYTVEEEWFDRDPDAVFADARRNIPLVDGVGYYFVAATISKDPDHPMGRLLGDLLVRLPSATGRAREPARRIRFSSGEVLPGRRHVEIANHPEVYEALRSLLS